MQFFLQISGKKCTFVRESKMAKYTHSIRLVVPAIIALLFSACNVTKFVPEDKYLLNKVHVRVSDTKEVDTDDLRSYLRQTPNTEILGFWKLQLDIYNTAPLDTTTKSNKRLARNAHKIGEAPEIFDEDLTAASMFHLQKAMQNKGYFEATVDTAISVKKRKLDLTYNITAGQPYHLRDCSYLLPQTDLKAVATDSHRTLLKKGVLFDADMLNAERKRIETELRHQGYFYFEKEMLRYEADSANYQADVEMSLQPYLSDPSDSTYQAIFRTYTVRRVCFHTDYDPKFAPEGEQLTTVEKEGYSFTYFGEKLLREQALVRNTKIRPGELYDQRKVDRTYEVLNGLGVVKYVDISFERIGEDELDCHIVLSRQKLHSVSAQVEGTYTSGDWGVAAEVGYTNRNIFRGAEELSIKARAGYEWRQGGGHAIEGRLNAGLSFPNKLKLELEGRYQDRPDEFNRIIANAALSYTIHRTSSAPWSHSFRFVDISYVYLPWIADEFRKRFLQPTNLLKYSYEDHFITAFSYQVNYTSYRPQHPYRSYGTFLLAVETAGNVLQGLSKAAKFTPDEEGKYTLGNIRFAQYAKLDFMFSGHHIINENHRFVYRGAVGVAIPYGNSDAIPFEKRYFSGGANSVRGWTARTLGPGTYCGVGDYINYDNQAGDIRLDLSVEYRVRIWKFIHAAGFVDAGNIWTIREYESQPGGVFRWSEFYKQLALSYGAGIRLDLNFLVLRLDLGVRLHDPARIAEGKQWRTAGNGLRWSDDCALHFAIGYPF